MRVMFITNACVGVDVFLEGEHLDIDSIVAKQLQSAGIVRCEEVKQSAVDKRTRRTACNHIQRLDVANLQSPPQSP